MSRTRRVKGNGARQSARGSWHRRLTKGVVSISQGLGRREMEYTTPATAVREPNPQGEGERNTANRSGIPGTTSLQARGPHQRYTKRGCEKIRAPERKTVLRAQKSSQDVFCSLQPYLINFLSQSCGLTAPTTLCAHIQFSRLYAAENWLI